LPLHHSAPRVRRVPQTPLHRFFLPWQHFYNRALACPTNPLLDGTGSFFSIDKRWHLLAGKGATLTDRRYLLAEKGGISAQELPSPC